MLRGYETYREGNRLEAKAAQGGLPRSVWETYSAFANSAGGVILLGVEELSDGSLHAQGVPDPEKLLGDFWNTVNNPQKVSVNLLTDSDVRIVDCEGARVVEVRVPRATRHDKPVYLNDNPKRSFRRNHAGDYLCRYEEVRSMMRDASDESYDARPLTGVRMDELDASTVLAYRQRYLISHDGHPWNELPDDDFLRCIGAAAVAEDGAVHPTGAGLLMFGLDWRIAEEFPNYFLDYRQQTSSSERWQNRVVSQSGDWTGNVYDFFYRTYNLMKQALKLPFRLDGPHRVDDTPAHRALREALANCLTNANYLEPRGVVCLWNEESIVIENPGGFRVDLQSALEGGQSDPRNANLMRLFAFVDVGERAGSGLPKIMSGWQACGYECPRYEESFGPDRTRLLLPLSQSCESGGNRAIANGESYESGGNRAIANAESYGKRFSDIRRSQGGRSAVLAYLEEVEVAGRAEVAQAIGLRASRTSDLLRELAADGLLVAEGSGRSRVYRIARGGASPQSASSES